MRKGPENMGRETTRPDRLRRDDVTPPVVCVDGPHLCEVQIWTPADWEAIPVDHRPRTAEFFPGLGWVAAVPIENLN